MQILHPGSIILTSIGSILPLFWPPENQKCQITYIDLEGGGEFWFDTELSPPDSAENQLCLNQTLQPAFSNVTGLNMCSQEKSYSI